ncbi:MAG: 5'/3'-nucleotidase SurE [bacterium]
MSDYILVTNDDGIHAEGIRSLAAGLEGLGDIKVIAPDREQSASSHSITLHQPLRITKHDENRVSVTGTPTDCVLLAANGVFGGKPRLVISGINHGPNLGDDVTYSGTVAAAMEGFLLGVPSIAVSLAASSGELHFATAARFARRVTMKILEVGAPLGALVNINVPNLPEEEIAGIRITKLGKRHYIDTVIEKTDPRGKPYFWIGGSPSWQAGKNTDQGAILDRYVSITPLHLDLTDYKAVVEMEGWSL